MFDGETVLLSPSVGNWSFPCQSQYWIDHDRIRWAANWSKERIEAVRDKDRRGRESWAAQKPTDQRIELVIEEELAVGEGFLRRLVGRLWT